MESIACLANLPRFYVDKKDLLSVKNKKLPRSIKKISSFFIFYSAFMPFR